MPKLVVVIDDERPIRDLVGALLTEEGWAVRTYSSAAVALQEITTGALHPDLVLLDMRMPGMDGPQFAEAVRRRSPDLPIVVMTAARDARHWAEAISAAGYIPKPFDIDWVIDTVAGIIGDPEGDANAAKFSLLPIPPLVQQKIKGWAHAAACSSKLPTPATPAASR